MTNRFFSPLEQFEVVNLLNLYKNDFDISLTNVVFLFLLFVALMYVFVSKWGNFKVIPTVTQYIMESFFFFVNRVVKQQLGELGIVYFPLIFVLFISILINNLLGLIPNGTALTSHIIVILLMSFSLLTSIFVIGLKKYNIGFLKIFIPTCPFLLLLILIPIEIFSYLIRFFSLAIRLAANIVAGHTLVYIVTSFIFSMSIVKYWFFFLLVIPLFGILVLEFGICFLQAYVFIILVCIYISDVLNYGDKQH